VVAEDTWQDVINTVLARVRDPDGAVHSIPLCQDLLTRLERLYNTARHVVTNQTIIATMPDLQLYGLPESVPEGTQILQVAHGNRFLERCSLTTLRAMDARWPRAIGNRFECFMQIGYTWLLLWPALHYPDTVTITSAELTADLTTSPPGGTLTIPAVSTGIVMQLLEVVLLLRQRDMLSFGHLMAQIAPRGKAPDYVDTASQAQAREVA